MTPIILILRFLNFQKAHRMEAMEQIPCEHCCGLFTPSPRHKNQRYCMKIKCRRAKKAAWKRHKMQTDPEFRQNQIQSNKKWALNNPGYWTEYRRNNPKKAERNRILQTIRNQRRRGGDAVKADGHLPPIAKVDASKSNDFKMVGQL